MRTSIIVIALALTPIMVGCASATGGNDARTADCQRIYQEQKANGGLLDPGQSESSFVANCVHQEQILHQSGP